MKKLNRKGFTLIELLAVIVILAIIVVVTVPTVLSSINDARLSSINSLSKEVATWYEESLVKDEMAFGSNYKSILNGARVPDNGYWYCLNSIPTSSGEKVSLFDVYGLKESDVQRRGTVTISNQTVDDNTDVSKFCSAIRIVNNKAEVLIIAASKGKFDTGAVATYGYSKLAEGAQYNG